MSSHRTLTQEAVEKQSICTPFMEMPVRVKELEPRHPREALAQMLTRSERWIIQEHKRYGHLLTAEQSGPRHQWLYSDADAEFLKHIATARDEAARAGIAETQRERLAILTAGVSGGRQSLEAIHRDLRASCETWSAARRVRELAARIPAALTVSTDDQLTRYLDAYYGSDSITKSKLAGRAESVETILRAFRAAKHR